MPARQTSSWKSTKKSPQRNKKKSTSVNSNVSEHKRFRYVFFMKKLQNTNGKHFFLDFIKFCVY